MIRYMLILFLFAFAGGAAHIRADTAFGIRNKV